MNKTYWNYQFPFENDIALNYSAFWFRAHCKTHKLVSNTLVFCCNKLYLISSECHYRQLYLSSLPCFLFLVSILPPSNLKWNKSNWPNTYYLRQMGERIMIYLAECFPVDQQCLFHNNREEILMPYNRFLPTNMEGFSSICNQNQNGWHFYAAWRHNCDVTPLLIGWRNFPPIWLSTFVGEQ